MCASEWFIPKNAFAKAIPARQDAFAIFSLALIAFEPKSTDSGKYLNTSLAASFEYGFVYSVAIIET